MFIKIDNDELIKLHTEAGKAYTQFVNKVNDLKNQNLLSSFAQTSPLIDARLSMIFNYEFGKVRYINGGEKAVHQFDDLKMKILAGIFSAPGLGYDGCDAMFKVAKIVSIIVNPEFTNLGFISYFWLRYLLGTGDIQSAINHLAENPKMNSLLFTAIIHFLHGDYEASIGISADLDLKYKRSHDVRHAMLGMIALKDHDHVTALTHLQHIRPLNEIVARDSHSLVCAFLLKAKRVLSVDSLDVEEIYQAVLAMKKDYLGSSSPLMIGLLAQELYLINFNNNREHYREIYARCNNLTVKWNPSCHQFFPPAFRSNIHALLTLREQPENLWGTLPIEVFELVVSEVAKDFDKPVIRTAP